MRKINVGEIRLGIREKNAVMEVLNSNRITEWKKVNEFEKMFSSYLDIKHTILVNSGTSALITAINSLNYLSKNSSRLKNIITTPLTFIATINSIKLSGYNPIFIDVESSTFNIDTNKIKNYLENIDDANNYPIILPVHLMGYPVEMNEINKIAKLYDMLVLEDASQAHGTIYDKKKCGTLSDVSTFSFYVAHNVQVGEMGAICTNNDLINSFSKSFKAHGRLCNCDVCTRSKNICPFIQGNNEEIDPRFYHNFIGYNFKTTDIMAAIGIEQLKKIEEIKKTRFQNVKTLNEGLEKISDIFKLPKLSEDVSYLAYPLIIKDTNKIKRNKLLKDLEKSGIENRPLFSCIPAQQPAYKDYKQIYENKLPNAEYIGNNGFYIGCHQYLSEEDLDYIIKTFINYFKY